MQDQFNERGVVVDNAIGFWIYRVYQASRAEMYRAFRERGEDVTPEQWAVLIRLWELDGRSQSELMDATFRDAPTMSRIIDGLEARGVLVRRAHEEDGRVRTIHLTRKGRELEQRLVPEVKKIVERMEEGIDPRALGTMRATLRRMFENLTE